MPPAAAIVSRRGLPEAVFGLLRIAFPDDKYDQRAFWPPDSVHAVVHDGGTLVAHAGFIVRRLYLPGREIDAAYVEYVAAEPRGAGHGTIAMRALEAEIRRRGFALAALSAGAPEFYDKLGWSRWRGPIAYRAAGGSIVPTPDEPVMVLDLGARVNIDGPIETDWRDDGDVW